MRGGIIGETSTLPNMSTCLLKSQMWSFDPHLCASPSPIVSEPGDAAFLPADLNLLQASVLHEPSSASFG